MKSKAKKISIRTTMLLLLMMLTTVSAWADDGPCGTNVTYTFEGSTLTISGTGAMDDYAFDISDYYNTGANDDQRPWKESRGDIEYVIIKKGVTHIGNNAFAMCTYLKSITFENGSVVESIGDYAFYGCDYELTSIAIPASVSSIGEGAFANCSSLQSVSVYAETPPTLGDDAFTGIYDYAEFMVRNDSYEAAEGWSVWAGNMSILDTINFDLSYIDANGQSATCPYATPITSIDYNFDCNQDLWFYVDGEFTIDSELLFNSDIGEGYTNIILCDGAKLTIGSLSAYNNLNIYGQANKTGEIIVNNPSSYAIYTDKDFTLNGGKISVTNLSSTGLCINNNLTINGGTISVSAVEGAQYGIDSYGENTTINGGTISISTVEGVEDFTGLSVNNNLTINDGEISISANGNSNNGISSNADITINGGIITASATGEYAAGIYTENDIILAGGTITASSYTANGSIMVDDGIFISDGTDIYSGTLFDNGTNGHFTTLAALNDAIGGNELTNVTDRVVTQTNFFSFFDDEGNLLDAVTFDELIFKGEFADLPPYITLDRTITVTGDNAVLNDIAFIVAGECIILDGMTLVANSNLGYLIDIAGENAVIQNMDISYTVDEAASAICVRPYANGVQIKNNTINFESTVDDYASDEVTTAICVNSGVSIFDDEDPIEGLVIDGNEITAVIPAFLADVYEHEYYVMGMSAVNGVRINGAEDFIFTKNTLSVTTNSLAKTTPTLQALYVASSSGLIEGNDISMIDTKTPEGKDIYLYAVELVNDEELTISNNNFNISTTGGKDEAGVANAILAIASEFEVTDNIITTVSNGPNYGIYFPSFMGAPCDAVISGNLINVTGLATSAHDTGLVSGIEIQTGTVDITDNTIYTYNIGEYAEGNYMYGISFAQDGSAPEVEITGNTIYTQGHYAISFLEVDDAEIADNILCAHLFGDAAVYIQEGDYTVKDNLGGICGTDDPNTTTVDESKSVTWLYDNDTHTLTISGTGPMMYYGSALGADSKYHSTAPWSYLDSEIQKVIVENGVTYIGSYAFAYCTALTSVSLPASVSALGNYVCYTSNVTRIDIPNTTAAATIGEGGFGYCSADLQIAVPSTLLGTYQIADNWSAYAAKLVGVLSEATGFGTGFATGNYEYTRTFKCGIASTVCLPFSLDATQAESVGKFYTFDGIDKTGEKWEVIMKETNTVSTDLSVNIPYLFVPYIFDGKSKGDAVELTFSGNVSSAGNGDYYSWTEPGSSSYWTFQGVFYNILWDETHNSEMLGKVYGFAANSYSPEDGSYTVNPGDFVKAGEGASIPSFRAFLQYTGSSVQSAPMRGGTRADVSLPNSMKVKLIDANGTITATGEISTETTDFIIDTWYDMNGHMLPDAPTTPGMYIHNGNQVLIKY